MSNRIETSVTKDESTKWSKNEEIKVFKAGVDIGEDLNPSGEVSIHTSYAGKPALTIVGAVHDISEEG